MARFLLPVQHRPGHLARSQVLAAISLQTVAGISKPSLLDFDPAALDPESDLARALLYRFVDQIKSRLIIAGKVIPPRQVALSCCLRNFPSRTGVACQQRKAREGHLPSFRTRAPLRIEPLLKFTRCPASVCCGECGCVSTNGIQIHLTRVEKLKVTPT